MHLDEMKSMWDLFICHASEDKDAIARTLAHALSEKGLRVWYDEFALSLGDSLRQAIDRGLAGARYGVVILSPNFLAKRWPQRELDGLTAKEISSGKTILPVWHNITREQVERFSPPLADKLAVTSSGGLDAIVRAVVEVVRADSARRPTSFSVVPAATEAAPVKRPARSAFSLRDFQTLVDYAFSSSGLNLPTRREAGDWAAEHLELLSRHDFSEFRQLVDYAFSSSGLNLPTRREAGEWAIRRLKGDVA